MISVIIPCYNAARTIAGLLEAIAGQTCTDPWEVIVADNGSTDESLSVAERYRSRFPRLQIVKGLDKRGAGYIRNVGAQCAAGDALLFCDADDEVAPGWLSAMARAFSRCDFVAGRLDTEKLNAAWTRIHKLQTDGLSRLTFYPFASFASSSNMGIRRAIYDAVGGFDEGFRFCEDVDLCCKVQREGVELRFVPDALVHYRLRASYRDIYRQARNWAEGTVQLASKYRCPACSAWTRWRSYLGDWKQLPRLLRLIADTKGRAVVAWTLGWNVGVLRGVVKHRTPPPCSGRTCPSPTT